MVAQNLPLIRSGSSKDVLDASSIREKHLALHFSDRFSVFDRGAAPWHIKGLGKTRAAIAVRCFEHFHNCVIATHYAGQLSEETILVKAAEIPELNQVLSLEERRILGVEVLFRFFGTKKFAERYMRGEIAKERFNFKVGEVLKEGYVFNPIFVECSTKFEEQDRYLSDEEAGKIAGITTLQREHMYQFVRNASQALSVLFGTTLGLRTGKFELILTRDSTFEIADSISPDELEFAAGFDKNIMRDFYKTKYPEWIVQLEEAKQTHRTDKSEWPAYPGPPTDEIMKLMLFGYEKVAEVIGC